MGPFIYIYAQNDGPILSIIYFITLRAHGPIILSANIYEWAHGSKHNNIYNREYGPIILSVNICEWAHVL